MQQGNAKSKEQHNEHHAPSSNKVIIATLHHKMKQHCKKVLMQ